MMLRAESLSCGYGGGDVLRGVSLAVSAGEFVAVAGPNGSGKSTLVRAFSGVLAPRAGRVTLGDRDLASLPARDCARAIAVVPQETAVDFDFSCEEIVLMGRSPHLGRFQSEGDADRAAVHQAMERTGTWDLRARSIQELSGGERQRVVLARAFAQEAPILLLDEPTAHLDLSFQAQVLRLVRARPGTSVLATLHDLNLAGAYADRIVLLQRGTIVAEGVPADVLRETVLRPIYGEDVVVRPHPDTGRPHVFVKT